MWLIEFAQVGSRQIVLATLARVLGVTIDEDGKAEQLAARLTDRKMLIVLDNCEHVALHIALSAAAILHRAPGIRLLATSQESMKLPDEYLKRLGAHGIPVAEPPPDPDDQLSDQTFGCALRKR